jgi:RimJ/RimL family protein N-acetyltransferase
MEVLPFKLKYVPDILSWVKTEAEMVQWAGHAFVWPMTDRQFRAHLKQARAPLPTLYPFALVDRRRLVGYCELSDHRRASNSAMLSRVIVAPRRRGNGYGTLMIQEALRLGFVEFGVNRIGLGVFDFNEAAIKCYERAGFIREGTLRESAKVGDSYWNCHLMSILQKEWTHRRAMAPILEKPG